MRVTRRGSQQTPSRFRGDDGVAAVELALVLPVLTLLVIGMLEFAFVMKDWMAISNSVRLGARTAASGPGDGPSATSGVPQFAQNAITAMQRAGLDTFAPTDTSLAEDPDNFIFIYDANSNGLPGSLTAMPTTQGGCVSAGKCLVYTWQKVPLSSPPTYALKYKSGTWASSSVNACANTAGQDSVGVYMHVNHRFMAARLSFIGTSLTLSDRAVMKFEPLPYATCNDQGPSSGGHD